MKYYVLLLIFIIAYQGVTGFSLRNPVYQYVSNHLKEQPRKGIYPIVYHRDRRSLGSDSKSTESSKSAHANGAKLPLLDTKHPSTIDLLPEHEPTDTNDKHVDNRKIVTMNEHLTNAYIPEDLTPVYNRPVYSRSLPNEPSIRMNPSNLEKPVSNNNDDYCKKDQDVRFFYDNYQKQMILNWLSNLVYILSRQFPYSEQSHQIKQKDVDYRLRGRYNRHIIVPVPVHIIGHHA